jgi:general secretion pathway protein E
MYQKTITRDLAVVGDDPAFISAVRALFRSALDVLLLGEIRDSATAQVATNIVQSGHSVYTTMHAKSTFGVIDRLVSDAIGVDRNILTTDGIVKLLVYQALLPKTCVHCGKSPRDYEMAKELRGERLGEHRRYFERIERLYDFDTEQCRLRDHDGCEHCRREDLPELYGLSGRTVVAELLELDDEMLRLIHAQNNIDLYHHWRSLAKPGYTDTDLIGKNTMECAVLKSSMGIIDPREIEGRFMDYETVELKRGPKAKVH